MRIARGPLAAAALLGLLLATSASPASATSADELVRIAETREREQDVDLALRRYMDALTLDPTHERAYLGLASLRARLGDLREAERVYTTLLERRPASVDGWLGRARVWRALGRADLGERDLRRAAALETSAFAELARWRADDSGPPVQLALWREIQDTAARRGDEALRKQAATMVRALALVVGPADPVTSPPSDSPFRQAVARLTRR